jgi:hypothetical protein
MTNAFTIIVKNARLILVAVIAILFFLLMQQCDAVRNAEDETQRIKNNQIALNDTIRNYKDKYGNSIGEIRGLTLTLEEVKKELEFEKGKPPVTVIKWKTIIVEKEVEVPVKLNDSTIIVQSDKEWVKSSRSLKVEVPYAVKENKLTVGNADIELKQNIWLTASLFKDTKTKEVFVQLKTDYPNVQFNEAKGILVKDEDGGSLFKSSSKVKTMGLGLHVGLGLTTGGLSPYVGVGLNYTPKFLQW